MTLNDTLLPGDPAPTFAQATASKDRFVFDTAAGRWLLLAFLGTGGDARAAAALETVAGLRDLLDDQFAAFFGVTCDAADRDTGRLVDSIPGIRFFFDIDRRVSRLYRALPREAAAGGETYVRFWLVIDPALHVAHRVPFRSDGSDGAEIARIMRALPPPSHFPGFEVPVPVIVLPNVFEAPLCRHLVDLYEKEGGVESGFMREVNGRTVGILDPNHKRRRDVTLTDERLLREIQMRVVRRIVPEIRKVHQFEVTRMERYIVSCYAAEEGGHFRAHRDNTTKGTAHRRFAVSINLNAAFEGGEISFPEYGRRRFKPPVGGAVIFSCSLLHEVSQVTAGKRYAFLPFLYDDAAARIREANQGFLDAPVPPSAVAAAVVAEPPAAAPEA